MLSFPGCNDVWLCTSNLTYALCREIHTGSRPSLLQISSLVSYQKPHLPKHLQPPCRSFSIAVDMIPSPSHPPATILSPLLKATKNASICFPHLLPIANPWRCFLGIEHVSLCFARDHCPDATPVSLRSRRLPFHRSRRVPAAMWDPRCRQGPRVSFGSGKMLVCRGSTEIECESVQIASHYEYRPSPG